MKKFFTLMAAFTTACAAWAAAPELLFGDEPVVPGKVYKTGYEKEVMDLGVMVITVYDQASNLYIKGSETEETVLEVKANEKIAVCSIDGLCVNGDDVTKKGYITAEPKTLWIHYETTDIDGANPEDILKDITVNVKAYYASSPNDYVETTVVMTNIAQDKFDGIAAPAVSGKVCLSNARTIDYDLDSASKLEIYNVSGALVMSRTIKGVGSVALETLHPGVYIYSAAGHTGKVLIRK